MKDQSKVHKSLTHPDNSIASSQLDQELSKELSMVSVSHINELISNRPRVLLVNDEDFLLFGYKAML